MLTSWRITVFTAVAENPLGFAAGFAQPQEMLARTTAAHTGHRRTPRKNLGLIRKPALIFYEHNPLDCISLKQNARTASQVTPIMPHRRRPSNDLDGPSRLRVQEFRSHVRPVTSVHRQLRRLPAASAGSFPQRMHLVPSCSRQVYAPLRGQKLPRSVPHRFPRSSRRACQSPW